MLSLTYCDQIWHAPKWSHKAAPTVVIVFEVHFQIPILMKVVASHNDNLEPGEPQLNWCDVSVMVSPVQLNSERKNWKSFWLRFVSVLHNLLEMKHTLLFVEWPSMNEFV